MGALGLQALFRVTETFIPLHYRKPIVCVSMPGAQVLGGIAFLTVMLTPFLRHISKESRRCAELLVQLPSDFDVDGMVAATWRVVKQVRTQEASQDFTGGIGASPAQTIL